MTNLTPDQQRAVLAAEDTITRQQIEMLTYHPVREVWIAAQELGEALNLWPVEETPFRNLDLTERDQADEVIGR